MTFTQACVGKYAFFQQKWIFSVRFRSNAIGNKNEFRVLLKYLKTGPQKRSELLQKPVLHIQTFIYTCSGYELRYGELRYLVYDIRLMNCPLVK